MRLAHDLKHSYQGYFGMKDGICRLRIYRPTEDEVARRQAVPVIPVVILTELPENVSTSVTNMVAYLAAEVLLKFLQDRVGQDRPFILIEEYAPSEGTRNYSSYSLVSFNSWRPKVRPNGRVALQGETWTPLSYEEVVAFVLGAEVEQYPVLDHPHPVAEPRRVKARDY